MASPQRKDPNEPEPILNAERRVEREVGTGRPFGWWWIWIPIVIAAFWFVGWGWGPYGGWWWGHGNESAVGSARATHPVAPATNGQPAAGTNNATTAGQANAAEVTGTGVAVLDSTNKATYVGQNFQIRNIPVESIAGPHAFWIGANNGTHSRPMLVVLPANYNGANNAITVGDRIDVSGKIDKAPPAIQARHRWSLNGGEANRVDQEGAYIQATQVQKLS